MNHPEATWRATTRPGPINEACALAMAQCECSSELAVRHPNKTTTGGILSTPSGSPVKAGRSSCGRNKNAGARPDTFPSDCEDDKVMIRSDPKHSENHDLSQSLACRGGASPVVRFCSL